MARMQAALQTVRGSDFEPHLLFNLALVAEDVGRADDVRSVVHELQVRFPGSIPAGLATSRWPGLRVESVAAAAESTGPEATPRRAGILNRLWRLLAE